MLVKEPHSRPVVYHPSCYLKFFFFLQWPKKPQRSARILFEMEYLRNREQNVYQSTFIMVQEFFLQNIGKYL